MLNALFVVWRESFEAVLIVGILYNFLGNDNNSVTRNLALRSMWLGVVSGIVLSAFLALAINVVETELQGVALEYFQLGMLVSACLLMTHMCLWMKLHGRHIKSDLETSLSKNVTKSKQLQIAILSMLAVAREGSETVVFLYGMTFEAVEKNLMTSLVLYSLAGFLLALLTWEVFNRGLRFFSQKVFFNVTTIFLLLTASSLILNVTRKLIQSDVLVTLKDAVWDTSALLDERSTVGQFVSVLTGYESTPSLMTVLVFFSYWGTTYIIYKYLMRRDIERQQSKHLNVHVI